MKYKFNFLSPESFQLTVHVFSVQNTNTRGKWKHCSEEDLKFMENHLYLT